MAQIKTLSKSYFLSAPVEVRDQIYQHLLADPTVSPETIYEFFTETNQEIYHETKRLAALFPKPDSTSPKIISDWRLSNMEEELGALTPIQLNTIQSLEVNAELWAWDPEDLENPEDAYIDDDGFKFYEQHDDIADWIVQVVEKFPGVESVELWSDGHGFIWEYALLIEQFEALKEKGGRWSVVDPDEEERTLSVKFEEEDGNRDWRRRDRTVFIDVR